MDNLNTTSTYALYKAGQNKFTNWLEHTADRCAKTTGSNKKSKSKHGSILPELTVHCSELQGLANTVVKCLSPEEIPITIVQTLRDVISQRRQSSNFFQRLSESGRRADEDLKWGNESHLHIIKVLENVLRLFDDRLKDRKREQDSTHGK